MLMSKKNPFAKFVEKKKGEKAGKGKPPKKGKKEKC